MRMVVQRGWWALLLVVSLGIAAPAVKSKTGANKKKTSVAKTTSNKAVKTPARTVAASSKRGKKQRYRVKRAPRVSAAVRSAAVTQISTRLVALNTPFENAGALVPFFERLHRMDSEKSPVHVLHYGDSHTASDDWPSVMREGFQGRFGNGGPGYVLPGHPFRGYRRYDLQASSSSGWITEGTLGNRGDGLQGLSGISLSTTRAGETMSFYAVAEEVELWFLRQPGGGSFTVELNGADAGQVSTDGDVAPASIKLETSPGGQRITIRTESRDPVRIFGAVFQQKTGITWETLGINGAYARMVSEWAEPLLGSHIASRDPAMIVIAYGTNEAHSRQWDPQTYMNTLRSVIAEFRRLAPAATLLMVGPPDCRVRSQTALTQLIEIQRRVAAETGVAFWDWRSRMGGPGSIRTWVSAGYAQGDYIHMTSAGYQLLGRTLLNDLLSVYDRFVQVRMEAANEQAR